MLENTRCLFDETATILRGRVQNRVELPLSHDHVHLAADARIGQQLLDVEQPALLTVDRVLRAAVAEQRARDRDLGVLDRQRAVGVVDSQRHLSATQRSTAGCSGEDDVFHLAAAQTLGTLLTHHPGEGVNHIGLARPTTQVTPGSNSKLVAEAKDLKPLSVSVFRCTGRTSPFGGIPRWESGAGKALSDST